jgi:hypothetical protein
MGQNQHIGYGDVEESSWNTVHAGRRSHSVALVSVNIVPLNRSVNGDIRMHDGRIKSNNRQSTLNDPSSPFENTAHHVRIQASHGSHSVW